MILNWRRLYWVFVCWMIRLFGCLNVILLLLWFFICWCIRLFLNWCWKCLINILRLICWFYWIFCGSVINGWIVISWIVFLYYYIWFWRWMWCSWLLGWFLLFIWSFIVNCFMNCLWDERVWNWGCDCFKMWLIMDWIFLMCWSLYLLKFVLFFYIGCCKWKRWIKWWKEGCWWNWKGWFWVICLKWMKLFFFLGRRVWGNLFWFCKWVMLLVVV